MNKLEVLLKCIPESPFKNQFTQEIKTLTAERDDLKSSIEAANNQAMYYGQECDRLRAALELIVSKAHRGSVWLDIEEVDQVRVALKGRP